MSIHYADTVLHMYIVKTIKMDQCMQWSLTVVVQNSKRYVFMFHCPTGPGAAMPMLIDSSGVYVRREGNGGNYICGSSPPQVARTTLFVILLVESRKFFDSSDNRNSLYAIEKWSAKFVVTLPRPRT